MAGYHAASGSVAEDLFIELFSDTFGAEKAGYLYSQYLFFDIYQNSRFADFALENGARRIAIEIDDEASHNKSIIAENKFYEHLLKQNSMVHLGWDIYRFAVRQMQQQPDTIRDELRINKDSYFSDMSKYPACTSLLSVIERVRIALPATLRVPHFPFAGSPRFRGILLSSCRPPSSVYWGLTLVQPFPKKNFRYYGLC